MDMPDPVAAATAHNEQVEAADAHAYRAQAAFVLGQLDVIRGVNLGQTRYDNWLDRTYSEIMAGSTDRLS